MSSTHRKERSSRSLRSRYQTLVLNADGQPLRTYPISIISAQDAISALWRERAYVVEAWPEVFFRSPSTAIPIPKVMMLREYAPVHGSPKFCRRSILLRDRFCCQYCGERFSSEELTYDHVVPRAAGGKTTWDNVVAACVPCNSRKSDQNPYSSAKLRRRDRRPPIVPKNLMRPFKEPRQPTTAELLRAGMEFLPTDVKETFGEWLYWTAELT